MRKVVPNSRSGIKAMCIAFSALLPLTNVVACEGDSLRHCCHRSSYSGYGAVGIQVQQVQARPVGNICFYGVYPISRHFGLGGGGVAPLSAVLLKRSAVPGAGFEKMQFGYGGIVPEFRFGMSKSVGVLVNTLVGVGGYSPANEGKTGGGGFFVIEPRILGSVRLGTSMRINMGFAFRDIHAFDAGGFEYGTLEVASALCQFQFGIFSNS